MEHNIVAKSPVEREVTVSFSAAEVNKYIDNAVKALGKEVVLNGFRPGKVPAKVVESRFIADVQKRATDSLINGNISKVLKEANLDPISRIFSMEVEGNEHKELKRDEPYVFGFRFEILPEIVLPDFSELEIELKVAEADPKEIADLTRRVSASDIKLVPIEEDRLPRENDICLVDIDGTIDGNAVPGMKGENLHIQIKSEGSTDDSDVDKIVRTMKKNEEKTGKLVIPADYPDPSYRGKEMEMKVKLHSISLEELPEINDEFAQKFGMESGEKLLNFIKETATQSSVRKNRVEAQNKLLDSLLEGKEFELPACIFNAHKNEYLTEMRNFLMQQGQEATQVQETLGRMEEEATKEATKQSRAQILLLALAHKEKITISEREVQEHLYRAAQETGQNPQELADRLYQSGAMSDLQERLLASKAMDYMFSKVKKTMVDKEGKKLETIDIPSLLPDELKTQA